MRTRRVGTISMAIVLIAFGILLFISQFSQVSAVELAIKFWPGILILIGLEILWYAYENKKDEANLIIKYDIFSMFIVFVILVVNLGIYGLMETGVMDLIKLKVAEERTYYEESYNR